MNKEFYNKEVVECVGLWLAEGDKKTHGEITFTNNCFDLIQYFHKTILKLFKNHYFNVRIYPKNLMYAGSHHLEDLKN